MINIVAEVRREHRHLRVAAVLLHDCFLDMFHLFVMQNVSRSTIYLRLLSCWSLMNVGPAARWIALHLGTGVSGCSTSWR